MRPGGILVPDGSAFVGRPMTARLRWRGIPRVRLHGVIRTVGSGSPVAGNRWTCCLTPLGFQIGLVGRAGVVDLPEFVTPRGEQNWDP